VVEIISKRDGPRREDVRARRLIEENRGTIRKLADHLSGGRFSESQKPKPAPEPEPDGRIVHAVGTTRPDMQAEPYVRISPNDRVVLVDFATGRQMHHLGDLRRRDGARRFVLATRENGYFSPVEESLATALADLDGTTLDRARTARTLADEIGTRLGIG